MSRNAAVLKVMALCGGVFGGLLVVVGIVMMINFCRKRCATKLEKVQGGEQARLALGGRRKSMPTITISPPTESLRVSSTELLHTYETSVPLSSQPTRHDSQQPLKSSNQRQASVDVVTIEIGSSAKQNRSFRELAATNRSYGSLQDRDDSPTHEVSSPYPGSPNAGQRPRRAESRRAAFKRNKQMRSHRPDSRRSSRSSGSFEMDAIAESAEETLQDEAREAPLFNKAEMETLKRQYEEVRATAAKQAFRHTKPITWDFSQKLQQTGRPHSNNRALSAGAAVSRMQRFDSFEMTDDCDSPNRMLSHQDASDARMKRGNQGEMSSRSEVKPFLEIWRLRSTFELEANDQQDDGDGDKSMVRKSPLLDHDDTRQSDCPSESRPGVQIAIGDKEVRDDAVHSRQPISKRDRYKQALLRRRQMQHIFPNMADSIDSNTTDNTSGRPADTATSFESNTSTATGMTENSAQLSIISSISAEEGLQLNDSKIMQSTSSSHVTITAANSQPRSPEEQNGLVVSRNVIGRLDSLLERALPVNISPHESKVQTPNRDVRHQLHSQHTVIMLTPPDYAAFPPSESRRRIDSGYRSIEHRSLSLATSDVGVPTRSRTLDTPDDVEGFQSSLRPPTMFAPNPYAMPSDYRSRYASASAMVPRTNSSRFTSLDSERDSVIVDEEELRENDDRRVLNANHFDRSIDTQVRLPTNHLVVGSQSQSQSQSQHLRGTYQPGLQPVYVAKSQSSSTSNYLSAAGLSQAEANAAQLHYAQYRQRKLVNMGAHRSYERAATQTSQMPLVRGYSQPYSDQYLASNDGCAADKQYFANVARAPMYDYTRQQPYPRRLPNPIGVGLPQRVTQTEATFGAQAQSQTNEDDARCATMHSLRYF